MVLLFLEFLGTTELLVIALVALIIFGPRKLPELGRSLGKSLGEFKRASEDFKRTWEREVEVDRIERDLRISQEIQSNPVLLENGAAATTAAAQPFIEHESAPGGGGDAQEARTIARGTTTTTSAVAASPSNETAVSPETAANAADAETTDASAASSPRKQDWL